MKCKERFIINLKLKAKIVEKFGNHVIFSKVVKQNESFVSRMV